MLAGQIRKSGFSLIELAIVMALIGLMIAAFLPLYSVMQQKKAVDLTKGRLADIRTALTL